MVYGSAQALNSTRRELLSSEKAVALNYNCELRSQSTLHKKKKKVVGRSIELAQFLGWILSITERQ
jgi:hypothetical protein